VNLAHLHLVMNHVPTIGSVAALGVLLLGYVRRNEHLKHVGLEVLFIVALLTLPVYVSGVAGYFEIKNRPDVSVDAVKIHQDVALFGFGWMMMAGFVQPTAGAIYSGARDITRVPPEDREFGMVFQGYALFPNMTVVENIGFALRIRKMDKAIVAREVENGAADDDIHARVGDRHLFDGLHFEVGCRQGGS